MEKIEVKTSELIGPALDWAVGYSVRDEEFISGHFAGSREAWAIDWISSSSYSPSTEWAQGGPLIEKYGIMLSPPKSLSHYNGGPKAGWSESGYWGTTIFGRDRAHRRASFNHETMPLVAAMRAVVQFVLGDTVSVPKELMQ